ncbi:glycosyl transferase family 90 [Sphingobacterium sp.]|uniref:glycosyl transferase family 90 n=1 Tax=Sphingobacterium sp. TaxID=341027 RepID=UPI0028970EE8|nr:glycosyl transferase family 90 [Sphingobacterium sp.]
MNIKKLLFQNKNFKPWYYLKAELREKFAANLVHKRDLLLQCLSRYDASEIQQRVDYYNKLSGPAALLNGRVRIADYHRPNHLKVYYYDSKEYLRYFEGDLEFQLLPGDVVQIPASPSIVKSRPIAGDNANSVLLNLDKVRHFNFIKDHVPFRRKLNKLIGRAAVQQEHRKAFYELYFDHPLCDLGDIMKGSKWEKPKISITEHLKYKFILAIEGNDVATNLKWIMSSNSIAVMPKPTYETWFMEGTLLPNVHYIEIKADYSDLEERLNYYIAQPEKAEEIVRNANAYCQKFQDQTKEDLIAVMVLAKYFEATNLSDV